MRRHTITLYSNSEYSLDDILKDVAREITREVFDRENKTKQKFEGHIEVEKEYMLSDYDGKKENPNWKFSGNQDTVARWTSEVVPDEMYINFQQRYHASNYRGKQNDL